MARELQKLKVVTIERTLAIKKANGLLDARAYRLTKVTKTLTG